MKTEEIEILQASYQGKTGKVKELLSRDPNLAQTTDFKGENWEAGTSALTLACCNGSIDTVTLLVQTGAKIDTTSNDGTALACASFSGHYEVVEFLLDSGANPNKGSSCGDTPLHAAAIKGYTNVCERLIESGAKVDAKTTEGTTDLIMTGPPVCGESPLHLAVAYGHVDTIKLLIRKGANKGITDHSGQKPIHWAGRYKQSGLIELLE